MCASLCVALLTGLIGPASAAVASASSGTSSANPVHPDVASSSEYAQQGQLTPSIGADARHFGSAMAVSGHTMVVGAPYQSNNPSGDPQDFAGAVYVFSNTSGSWQQTAVLTASDADRITALGTSVAIDGNTIVAGAPDNLSSEDTGLEKAYVFTYSGGSWSQTAELTASGTTTKNDDFGAAVAISGDTAVVGAPGTNNYQGTAYVFHNSGGTWTQTKELTAGDAVIGTGEYEIGWSLAMDADTIITGARYADSVGAVYVYTNSGGNWSQTAKLSPSDSTALFFGYAVALSGDTIVAGAPYQRANDNESPGATYVFTKANGAWTQTVELDTGDPTTYDDFGYSVAISGSTLVSGAPGHAVNGQRGEGTAYVFTRVGGTWKQTGELPAPSGSNGFSNFPRAVVVSGTSVLASAEFDYTSTTPEHNQINVYGVVSTLSVTARLTGGKSTVGLGASVPVSVTVTAGTNNPSNLTDLRWGSATTNGIGITPVDAASVTSALSPSLPSTLAPGQSVVLSGTIKTGTKSAAAVIASTVNSLDGDGEPVSGTGHVDLSIGGKALALSIATAPKTIHLDVTDEGKIKPKKVTVSVTYTNTTKKTLKGVRLLTLVPSPKDPAQQLDQLGFAKKAVPDDIAAIKANKSVTVDYPLEVTGDGAYVIRATALFPDDSAKNGNGRASVEGGDFESVVPFYYFTASVDKSDVTKHNGGDYIRGGDSWYVQGKLKNLSSYQSLCLPPMVATTTGNTDTLGMQDIAQNDATAAAPPIAGLIKPGKSYSLAMLVDSSSVGGTRGSVTLPTKAFKAVPGSSCQVNADGSMSGAGDALTTKQTDIADGSTNFTIHVDVSQYDGSTTTGKLIAFFGGYTKGSIIAFATFAHGIFALMKEFGSNILAYSDAQRALMGDPAAAARIIARANSQIMAMTALVAHYLETATPAEKKSLGTLLQSAYDRASGDAYNSLSGKWDAVANAWFSDITAAEKSGNAEQVWSAWGEANGNFITSAALQVLMVIIGKKLSANPEALEEASAAATGEGTEIATSKGGVVDAGRVLTLANEEKAWGITAEQDAAIGDIAARTNTLIGVRSRQGVSTLLEKLGAVWKNSNFHQKTISAIDRAYLGFPATTDEGLLGWRSFTAEGRAAAEKAIADGGLSSTEKTEALARLQGRLAENGADFQKMKRLLDTERNGVKGWVNAGFNATESGRATSSVSRWRRFTVIETELTDANGAKLGTFYEPYEENINFASAGKFGRPIPPLCKKLLGTVMCPITGDLDLVYITDLYGGSLSAAKMLEVFKLLSDAGFAHTDLVTWIEQQSGKFMFPGKASQLAGVAPGAEAVVQFAPDAVRRATYVDLAKSIVSGPNQYQLTIDGTWTPAMR